MILMINRVVVQKHHAISWVLLCLDLSNCSTQTMQSSHYSHIYKSASTYVVRYFITSIHTIPWAVGNKETHLMSLYLFKMYELIDKVMTQSYFIVILMPTSITSETLIFILFLNFYFYSICYQRKKGLSSFCLETKNELSVY